MKIKEVSIEEYEKLWDELKGKLRFTSPNIDPAMRRITVEGRSGPGTPFDNEYDRMLHEHWNPPIPRQIEMHDLDGMYIISPKKSTK